MRAVPTWLSLMLGLPAFAADLSTGVKTVPAPPPYQNYRNAERPWSVHVVRLPRRDGTFEVHSVHADGSAIGLGRLSDQARTLRIASGVPLAAINGDFYQREGPYAGDPRGLQIVEGELISAPSGTASFWIDSNGEPHATNTVSLLQVTWPEGTSSPMGLNGNRTFNGIELYTPAVGRSTQTRGGREFLLEGQRNSPWLPLQPGKVYRARVRLVREGGNAGIPPSTLVLSVAPQMIRRIPAIEAGAELTLSTETAPSLLGARAAISGGPVLLRGGKPPALRRAVFDSYDFRTLERHPRSAIGWNEDYFFLVEVDGRRSNLSVGMTLLELALYMANLGCREALNLDGGGSATLWYNGKVRNNPCEGDERFIANSVVIVQRKPVDAGLEKGAGSRGSER